ncbi:DUF1254 domain-containing protein [Formosa sp. PL04]|uniref:DUF1254 domain-containing protein n=1 Tax=Formosa sp. PL04 TaxID=3081755 RepID=UPI002981B9EA|nr:DUF1254 domain-containing protein [Formosa sp. PL04]MDW5290585.1 DUF1254 domain-containing protein [Formosa sp. PL04]
MKQKSIHIFAAVLIGVFAVNVSHAQKSSKIKMTTPIPESITTPAKIESRIGTLEFPQGSPTQDTADKLYEYLDFMHGVEAFLYALPGASVHAAGRGIKSMGGDNQTVLIMEELMNARSLFLTANTQSIYSMMWLDLKDGPLVLETPPDVLGIVNDHWFRYVGDIGNAGPDKGKGGKYLLLPPGYKGEVPQGYFVLRSQTYQNLYFWRGFIKDGSTATAVANTKKFAKVYPLSAINNQPEMKYIDVSDKDFNTIGSNDYSFYTDINEIVQAEPNEAYSPEILGMLAAIGIEKGKTFAPDDKLKKTLTEAVAVGNAAARTIAFQPRMDDAYLSPGSSWFFTFVGGSYQFLSQPGVRNLAARDLFHYSYTGITPAMAFKMVGLGSQYVMSTTDSKGKSLDGSKTYKIQLPANVPAKDFWSLVAYDSQTRSMLQTDQAFPSVGTASKGIVTNADGTIDIWFSPTAPKGHEKNWVQTIPGRGWAVLFRLYGPEESWFNKTWMPGELELVK